MFHTPHLYDKFGAHWHLGFVSSVSFPVNKLLSQTTSSNRPSDAAGTEVDQTGPEAAANKDGGLAACEESGHQENCRLQKTERGRAAKR